MNKNTWKKVDLFLTRRCNLKCRGCNVINFRSSYEMSTKECKKAFDILKGMGTEFIAMLGGEPTLRDDLPDLVEYLNALKMNYVVATNGIRLLKDDHFYRQLIGVRPASICTSVNTLNTTTKFHDHIKSDIGYELLMKLMREYPEGNPTASVLIMRENINQLPDIVSHLSEQGIRSILGFYHAGSPGEGMYWWFRGPINEDNQNLILREDNKEELEEVSRWFIANYDKLKLINNKTFFDGWSTVGIKQNGHCTKWVCPAINPDGSVMACIDRPLIKPFSIFDLPNKYSEMEENFKLVSSTCPGCAYMIGSGDVPDAERIKNQSRTSPVPTKTKE